MKKLVIVGIAALSLTLTACGGQSFDSSSRNNSPQFTQSEMDPNNRSTYNNSVYCNGHTYVPLPGDEYQCEDFDHSGVVIFPHSPRSKYTTAPKLSVPTTKPVPKVTTAPKAPVQAPKAPTVPKSPVQAPKAPVQAPKAPAYKAPVKTGK